MEIRRAGACSVASSCNRPTRAMYPCFRLLSLHVHARVAWTQSIKGQAARQKDSDSATQPAPLYQQYVEAKRAKRIGVAASVAILAAAFAGAVALDAIRLPSVSVVSWTAAAFGGAATLALAQLYISNAGQVHIEWHDGRLWIETGVPPAVQAAASPLPPSAVAVRPTGDARGNGAFAQQRIGAGTFIGRYEGDMLDLQSFYARYSDGVADYCMTIDGEWCLDGSERSRDTGTFSACHINHSATRHNVARRTLRKQQQVELFATRDIAPGEELLLDYGRLYWTGREHLELP